MCLSSNGLKVTSVSRGWAAFTTHCWTCPPNQIWLLFTAGRGLKTFYVICFREHVVAKITEWWQMLRNIYLKVALINIFIIRIDQLCDLCIMRKWWLVKNTTVSWGNTSFFHLLAHCFGFAVQSFVGFGSVHSLTRLLLLASTDSAQKNFDAARSAPNSHPIKLLVILVKALSN